MTGDPRDTTATPDNELAEAEFMVRSWKTGRGPFSRLLAEYDRRGAQIDAVLALLDHDVHLIDAPSLARVIRTALGVESS